MNTEDQIQAEIAQWFHNNYCLRHHNPRCCIFSVPNGGDRHRLEAIKMKATGLLGGVSDLIVVMPNKILFVEVKTEAGAQSPDQKEFESTIKKLGFEYFLVRSLEDFKKIIQ